jgi:LysR family nitrogen assimilation transcriptional regulator
VKLHQLRYFLRVAELRSFTRAAAVLHIAQSALSRQVHALEEELGVALLQRLDRGVALTDAGTLFKARIASIMEELGRARDEATAAATVPAGRLSFGLPPSMFELVTVPLLAAYLKRYPRVLLRVIEGISADLHELVLGGRLDAAVIASTEGLERLESRLLVKEQLWLVGAADAPLKLRGALALERVAELPLIVTSERNALRLAVEQALARKGLPFNVACESNSARVSLELAAAGAGWAVLPFCGIRSALIARRVKGAPIRNVSVVWALVHARERALSAAAGRLGETLFEIAAREVRAGRWKARLVE